MARRVAGSFLAISSTTWSSKSSMGYSASMASKRPGCDPPLVKPAKLPANEDSPGADVEPTLKVRPVALATPMPGDLEPNASRPATDTTRRRGCGVDDNHEDDKKETSLLAHFPGGGVSARLRSVVAPIGVGTRWQAPSKCISLGTASATGAARSARTVEIAEAEAADTEAAERANAAERARAGSDALAPSAAAPRGVVAADAAAWAKAEAAAPLRGVVASATAVAAAAAAAAAATARLRSDAGLSRGVTTTRGVTAAPASDGQRGACKAAEVAKRGVEALEAMRGVAASWRGVLASGSEHEGARGLPTRGATAACKPRSDGTAPRARSGPERYSTLVVRPRAQPPACELAAWGAGSDCVHANEQLRPALGDHDCRRCSGAAPASRGAGGTAAASGGDARRRCEASRREGDSRGEKRRCVWIKAPRPQACVSLARSRKSVAARPARTPGT